MNTIENKDFQLQYNNQPRRGFSWGANHGGYGSKKKLWFDQWEGKLPESIMERLGRDNNIGHQRMIHNHKQMLLVLYQLPEVDRTQRKGLLIWIKDEDDWVALWDGKGYIGDKDIGDVVDGKDGKEALEWHLQFYENAYQSLYDQEHQALSSKQFLKLARDVYMKQYAAENLYKVLYDARNKTRGKDNLPNTSSHLIDMRDRAYGVQRDLKFLNEDIKNAIHFRDASQSGSLSSIAAFFFPLVTAIALITIDLHTHSHNYLSSIPAYQSLQGSWLKPELYWETLAIALLLGWCWSSYLHRRKR